MIDSLSTGRSSPLHVMPLENGLIFSRKPNTAITSRTCSSENMESGHQLGKGMLLRIEFHAPAAGKKSQE